MHLPPAGSESDPDYLPPGVYHDDPDAEPETMLEDADAPPVPPLDANAERRRNAAAWAARAVAGDSPDDIPDRKPIGQGISQATTTANHSGAEGPAEPARGDQGSQGTPETQSGAPAEQDAGEGRAPSTDPPPDPALTLDGKTAVRERLPVWAPAFLAAYSVGGSLTKAADAACITRTAARNHAQRSPHFAELLDEAKARSIDHVRQEVFDRGVEDWSEAVYYGGEIVGHVLRKSDPCLLAYLKASAPEYRDKQELAHTVAQAPQRTPEEEQAQLAPYTDAALMLLRSLADAENVMRGAVPALPAPQDSAAPTDQLAAPPGPSLEAAPLPMHGAKKCPRCAPLVTPSPFCPICHGRPFGEIG